MLANLLYLVALTAVAPLILYRRIKHQRYRRGWRQKLFGVSADHAARLLGGATESGCLWLHAVSVGEVNLLGGIVSRLEQQHPDLPIVISVGTDSGYDLAVQRFGQNRVFFGPLDFSWAVGRTIRHLRPQLLVLAELELWPNLIRQSARSGAGVMVINGRLSDRSASGYRRFRFLTHAIFQSLHRVECQDETSANNFRRCGTPENRVHVSGSLKFDDAPERRDTVDVQSRSHWAGVDPWHQVWVVGSTQEGEEAMALRIYQRLLPVHPELRLILVPRHRERFSPVAELIRQQGLTAFRRSDGISERHREWTADQVILIDTIGELRHWWGVGQIATVGGSFCGDRGGQNMLEPAGYGSAVSFGPDTRNFAEIANRLLDADAAVRAEDESELQRFVERCLQDPPAADALGRAAQQLICRHRGATKRTLDSIESMLAQQAEHVRPSETDLKIRGSLGPEQRAA
ncbi:3-deoxy-D-manno-octulosonic acid transferase [Roseiconus nitratireducens]|uniref:3-deoxy-D-manno-octulosonic acid transferase n=1 Tax=Roseiconus nitratireducens TaxID=2605748 RepID=A0A5M6D9R9_9BACT|nr:3-deoxy-D-manno-octulosonic acid transferase [Roseiconus nitratireducens]KAA5544318.1 3-deoxy-D-manno-octulosonic acid transferase [Roseiconus nitratireducens]